MYLNRPTFNIFAGLYIFTSILTAYINLPIQYIFAGIILLYFLYDIKSFKNLTIGEISLFLFLIIVILSTIFSEYPSDSFTVTLVYIINLLPIILISIKTKNSQQLLVLFKSACFATGILILISLTLVKLGSRLEGVVGQANGMAFLASSSIVINYILLKSFTHSKVETLLFNILLVCSMLALLLTMSRGGILSIIIFVFLVEFKSLIKLNKKIILICFLALGVIIFFYEEMGIGVVFERFQGLTNALGISDYGIRQELRHSQDTIRIELISIAFNLFNKNILLGNGLDTFQYHSDFIYTHTNLYEIMYSTGLLGLSTFYMIYTHVVYQCVKYKHQFKSSGLYKMIAPVIIFHISYGFFIPYITNKLQIVLFIYLLTAFRVLCHEYNKKDS